MRRLTIGAFARAARLSPKALRLYDELDLLAPVEVDPSSGYRYYSPDQLDRARLIAWLRRLGMPLTRIRRVCDQPREAAASEVRAYWAEVVAETAVREQLVTFLVDYLSGRGMAMSTLGVRYAARSDAGTRASNEDIAYAGGRVWAVADGTREHSGELASAAAVAALRPLAERAVPAGELLNVLTEAVASADRAIRDAGAGDGAATTLTAMVWSGPELGLVHIGDTRAYVLRDGELLQITHDHTYVQSLVDEGKLTPEEAESHPQRAMLTRALSGQGEPADVSVLTAYAGDRYLLCSDGLSTVVRPDALRTALVDADGPDRAVTDLVALAHAAGAPDNIACVVADVITI